MLQKFSFLFNENQISIFDFLKFLNSFVIYRTIELILTHYVFIYFSSQQDEEEKKKKEKDRQRQSQCFKKQQSIQERDIEQQTNNQTRSVCMKKKMKKKVVGRERTNSHTTSIHKNK